MLVCCMYMHLSTSLAMRPYATDDTPAHPYPGRGREGRERRGRGEGEGEGGSGGNEEGGGSESREEGECVNTMTPASDLYL